MGCFPWLCNCSGGVDVDAQFLPTLHDGHPLVSCISRHLGPVLPPPPCHEMATMYVCGNSNADQKRLAPWRFVETSEWRIPNCQEGTKKGVLQE
jgi:hypothetical protein